MPITFLYASLHESLYDFKLPSFLLFPWLLFPGCLSADSRYLLTLFRTFSLIPRPLHSNLGVLPLVNNVVSAYTDSPSRQFLHTRH